VLPREALRTRRDPVIALRALALILTAALALGAGACGDEDETGVGEDPAGGAVSFMVTLDPDGPDGKRRQLAEEVGCEAGSDDVVCQAVAELDPADLAPASPDAACTELYGGPDTVSLEGTIRGEQVDVELTRSNGCEIERFDAAVPVLQALFPDYEPGESLAP